jgi:hypothetical protein
MVCAVVFMFDCPLRITQSEYVKVARPSVVKFSITFVPVASTTTIFVPDCAKDAPVGKLTPDLFSAIFNTLWLVQCVVVVAILTTGLPLSLLPCNVAVKVRMILKGGSPGAAVCIYDCALTCIAAINNKANATELQILFRVVFIIEAIGIGHYEQA